MSAAAETFAPSSQAQEFLDRQHLLLIGGQWVDPVSREEIEVFDPATENLITCVNGGGPQDIDRAVAAARAALEGEWSRVPS